MSELKNFLGLESSFGYHTDLHLGDIDLDAGAEANPDILEKNLRELMPDWVQVDGKGHRGYTCWFSKVPDASVAPHLHHDAVAAWREATRRLGVQLVVHYSGILDLMAGKKHPEWLAVPSPEDTRDTDKFCDMWMCLRSDYLDKLLIPQLIELAVDYKVDGTWVDGNSWGYRGCWCDKCKAEFTRRTGITEIPLKPGDKYWKEWYKFHLDTCEEAVEHFTHAVKAVAPNFRICSAWYENTYFPTSKTISTDWLSGDLSDYWTCDQINFDARWLANQGKPWDLMSWGTFSDWNQEPDHHIKTPDMLCQEATPIISAGGRYIIFELLAGLRTARQVNWRMRQYRHVRDFVKARESFCRGSEGIPEIALLHDRSDSQPEREIHAWMHLPTRPATSMLLDNHYGVDVLDTRGLLPRLKEFPMVVIPETGTLKPELTAALKQYVEDGGRLLVAGVDSIANFGADYFGFAEWSVETECSFKGRPWTMLPLVKDATPYYYVSNGADGVFPVSSEKWGLGVAAADAEGTEKLFTTWDPENPASATGKIAFCMKAHGKGFAAAIPANIFSSYPHHYFLREARAFMGRVLKRLMPERAIDIEAPTVIAAMFRRKNGKLYIHLCNRSSGIAFNPERRMIDEIPPVGPVTLHLHLAKAPAAVRLMPSGKDAECHYENGVATVTVQSVHIMESVEVQPAD